MQPRPVKRSRKKLHPYVDDDSLQLVQLVEDTPLPLREIYSRHMASRLPVKDKKSDLSSLITTAQTEQKIIKFLKKLQLLVPSIK